MREVEFDQAYIFKYSERRDTPAAAMPEQVPQPVREERHERLLALVNEQAARRYEALLGQRVEILVEGPSKKNPARLMGRTRCNKIVVFDGLGAAPGPADGGPDHEGRLVYALRGPGDCEFVRSGKGGLL